MQVIQDDQIILSLGWFKMAYFKLVLLTPYSSVHQSANIDIYNSIYLEDLITEFNPQLDAYKTTQHHAEGDVKHPIEGYSIGNPNYNITDRKFSTAFSYGEKVTFSQNGQKSMSFSMNRYIIRENERLENPFVNLLQTGSQLLLTDQYGNEYFFTVTSIKYTVKETNIIYDYTCQDSFTYQTSRQNQEYFIDNDPTSADYIGPKTADWWIVHKVIPECHLSTYNYIPCSRALYENTNGHYCICDNLKDKNDIKRIIKEPHTIGEDNYYTTFAYSCSGMNAASVLIDIASKINMQLHTCEHARLDANHERTKYFDRYFWIEPLKNDQRVGLEYSPKNSIQNFDLSHKGDSLTTVLNVTGPTYNDEIITLIPNIPSFFHNYFLRPEWDTMNFNTGMFTQACLGQQYIGQDNFEASDLKEVGNRFDINTDTTKIQKVDKAILLPIYSDEQSELFNFNIDLYEHFTFLSTEDNQQSRIQLTINGTSITTLPNSDTWILAQQDNTNNYQFYHPGQNFIHQIDRTKTLYLGIILDQLDTSDVIEVLSARVYLRFFRDVSQEEMEFATIADQCPWLENKIIDFTYFLKQNIISRKEYNSLMSILYNDLRKVNGKLIYYTQAYYKAIHDKTEMLANLTNQLDTLGAAAQAAVIDPLATTGKVQDLSYFERAYNAVFDNGEQEIMGLLDYNHLVADYFTKYFNAEQRFLKNIYNFRKYFNAPNPLHNKSLYHYTLTLQTPSWQDADWTDESSLPHTFYGFTNNKFISLKNETYPFIYYSGYNNDQDDTTALDYGKPFLSIFKSEKGTFTPVSVASKDKWTNQLLYKYPNFNGEEKFCTTTSRYSEAHRYLKLMFKVAIEHDKKGNYWSVNNKNRYIASTSTRNYRAADIVNFNDNTLLYGIYKITIAHGTHPNRHTYHTYCKATTVRSTDDQYYLYLTQLHQGEWFKDENPTAENLDIFTTLFDSISFEQSSYQELSDELTIQAVYINQIQDTDDYYYSPVYFNEDPEDKEFYKPTKAYLGLEHASTQDLQENWVYSHFDTTNAIIKKQPYYRDFSKQNLDNAWAEMQKWAAAQLIIFAAQDWTLEDIKEHEKWFQLAKPLSLNLWLMTPAWKNIYTEHFPITDFYTKTPRYRMTNIDNHHYVFERLNEENKSFTQYLQYLYPDNNTFTSAIVENPYSFTEYRRLNFVTKENASQYYKRIISYATMGSASNLGINGAGWSLFGASDNPQIPTFLAQTSQVGDQDYSSTNTPQYWSTIGVTERDFFGQLLSNNTRFSGYWMNNNIHAILYAVTAESFGLYRDYLQSFWANYYPQTSTETEPKPILISSLADWDKYKNYVWESADFYKNAPNKIQLKRPTSLKPFYYTIIDQHIGYDLAALDGRSQTTVINNFTIAGEKTQFIDKDIIPLNLDSIVNKHDNLFMLWLGTNLSNYMIYDSDEFVNFLKNGAFSAAYYYPLVNCLQKINITTLHWDSNQSLALQDIITQGQGWTIDLSLSNSPLLKITQQGTGLTGYAVFFLARDYSAGSLQEYYEYPDNISKILPRLFNAQLYTDFNYFAQEDIVKGFYLDVDLTTDKVIASTLESDFDMNGIYYDTNANRIFTIKQLKEQNNYVYLHSFMYEKDDIWANPYYTTIRGTIIGNNITNIYNVSNINAEWVGMRIKYKKESRTITRVAQNTIYFDSAFTAQSTEPSEIINVTMNIYNQNIAFHVNLSEYTINYEQKDTTSPYYISSIEEKVLNDVYDIQFDLSTAGDTHPTITSTKTIDINESTSLQINLLGNWISDIAGISNGTFWYLYHTNINLPTLFSTAAAIEAELTGYWNEAYTASKFCEYFLPESWTPISNQKNNFFSPAIFTVVKEQGNTQQAILLNSFLPEVEIVKDDNAKTILTRYQYNFSTDISTLTEHIPNTRYVLEDQDQVQVSSRDVVQHNLAIRNALKIIYRCNDTEVLNIATKWHFTDIGTTTYYYSDVGGTSWADLVQQYISDNRFVEFNGWYVMALRWLKLHYQNWTLTEYELAKKEHDAIWNKLYQQFGHILLENTFHSDTATSATELLEEAKLTFKDRAKPEREYNITVIDTSALNNYTGAEIRIGDGIRVKATDYYDQYDLIYESLTQYLFITDIQYTLRDTTNIALTVNDLKYADTIVKRLAKLIK